MATINDPHPRTQWKQPFAELVAAIRRTDDPLFAFEVVQALGRAVGVVPLAGPDDPAQAVKTAGWAYIEALRVAAEDCDRVALARESARFVKDVERVVRGWADGDLRERLRTGNW